MMFLQSKHALYELGFKNPNTELIGHDGKKYFGYFELIK
jgi:hypothetical protein